MVNLAETNDFIKISYVNKSNSKNGTDNSSEDHLASSF